MIFGIGACDPRGVMGKEGQLPWHYPEELRHFSETTSGFPMIMGHNTFLSMPPHYFEGRTTIIFTHHKPSRALPNQWFVSSMSEFNSIQKNYKKLYVIGGAQIYTLFLKENLITEFILTKLTLQYDGDTLFPLELLTGWEEQRIRITPEFTIYRYLNPLETAYANKNT